MKCNDTSKLIIDKLAGELSTRQVAKLDKHLASCEACRKESEMLSKAWQASNETLKEDSFAKELTPNRRAEIFAVAQHEEKRKRSSRVITRVVEYFAVVMICIILAGMLLPSLSVSRERARLMSLNTTKKQVGLGVAMEAPQSKADNFDTEEDEGSDDKYDVDQDGFPDVSELKALPKKRTITLALYSGKESRSKPKKAPTYRDKSQSYMNRIRSKLAGVTNTLGGEPAPQKASKMKVRKPVALSAPAPWSKCIETSTAVKKKDWHVKAPKGVAIKEFTPVQKVYRQRARRKAPAPCVSNIQADVSKKQPILIKEDSKEKRKKAYSTQVLSKQADVLAKAGRYNLAKKKYEQMLLRDIHNKKAIKGLMSVNKKINKMDVRRLHAQDKVRIAEVNWKTSTPIIPDIPLHKETFKLNLKLWNMTTVRDVRKYLRKKKCPANVFLINKYNNTITVKAPKETLDKIRKVFKKLQDEERELKDLSKGLPFIKCLSRPISTFSIDTDTASYIQARKSIRRGERPDPFKIRPEEFINYFDYNYRSPVNTTFAVYPEAAPSPFRPNNTLFRVGIQGKRLGPDANTRTHYTILLDTSGSMAVKDRMELAKKALAMMLKKLKSSDYISLLLCGNKTKVVFRMRALNYENRQKLLRILNGVTPRSVANFANGISQAYSFADRYYLRNSANRIIIISDGIFELDNAGRQNITTQIEAARKRGISNIVIGLGGDGDDNMLEKVASIGDGAYVFLDTEREAKELFTTQFEARFREIARDVKIQVQFNPLAVKSYRQIGYKNRQLSKADFRNDKVDAGEVGSGQSVTALYELKLKDSIPKDTIVATVRIRYKKAGDMSVEEKAFSLYESDIKEKFRSASPNFKLSAFVAEFAESLRYPETQGIASVRGIADQLNGTWMKHYKKDYKVTELLSLIKRSR